MVVVVVVVIVVNNKGRLEDASQKREEDFDMKQKQQKI